MTSKKSVDAKMNTDGTGKRFASLPTGAQERLCLIKAKPQLFPQGDYSYAKIANMFRTQYPDECKAFKAADVRACWDAHEESGDPKAIFAKVVAMDEHKVIAMKQKIEKAMKSANGV